MNKIGPFLLSTFLMGCTGFEVSLEKLSTTTDPVVEDPATPGFQISLANGDSRTKILANTFSISGLTDTPTEMALFSNNDCSGTASWVPFSDSGIWTLTSGDGTKALSVLLKNNTSTWSCGSDTITLDQTPPTSIAMNGSDNGNPTNTVTVTVSPSASDDATPLSYKVSSFADCSDGSWQFMGAPSVQNLPAPTSNFSGTKTLYYSVKDSLENESNCLSYNVNLDTVAPTVTLTGPSSLGSLSSATTAVSGTCSDTGVGNILIQASSTGGGSFSSVTSDCSSGTWSKTMDLSPLAEGTVTVSARLTDAAGNIDTKTLSISLDKTPPTGTLTINSGDADTEVPTVSLQISQDGSATHMAIYEGTCPASGSPSFVTAASTSNIALTSISADNIASESRTAVLLLRDAVGNISCTSDSITLNNSQAMAGFRSFGFRVLDSSASLSVPLVLRNYNGTAVTASQDFDLEYSLDDGAGTISKGTIPFTSGTSDTAVSIPIPDVTSERMMKLSLNYSSKKQFPLHIQSSMQISVADSSAANDAIGLVTTGDYHSCAIKGSNSLLATGSSGKLFCWGDNATRQINGSTTTDALTSVAIDAAVDYSDIASGGGHTCGITSTGVLKCWGANNRGQLGRGSIDATAPAGLFTISHPGARAWVSVATGGSHTCAIDDQTKLFCWGADDLQQLGNGSASTDVNAPAEIDSTVITNTYVQVSTGEAHTCALHTTGFVYCWGKNDHGQANPSSVGSNPNVPAKITLPGNVPATNPDIKVATTHRVWDKEKRIAAGGSHSCAVTSHLSADNTDSNDRLKLYCWGKNDRGQAGNFVDTNNVTTPLRVTGTSVFHVATGFDSTCTITYNASLTARTLRCFGSGDDGKLGNGTTADSSFTIIDRDSKVTTTALTKYNHVAVGHSHTCAVATATQVSSDDASPLSRYGVRCSGDNNDGQLGQANTSNLNTPTTVDAFTSGSGGSRVLTNPSVGARNTCAMDPGGSLYCWGSASVKLIGDGVANAARQAFSFYRSGPTKIAHDSVFSKVSVGGQQACALTTSNKLKCWGENSDGHLAPGSEDISAPLSISPSSSFTKVSSGGSHVCVINGTGGLFCWGVNTSGQVGDSSTTLRNIPTAIDSGIQYAEVSAGEAHTCAITTGSKLKCWGAGANGRLGVGSTSDSTTPLAVDAANDYIRVSAGTSHTCALRRVTSSTGSVQCWGSNTYGQIGNNTSGADVTTPTAILDSSGTPISDLFTEVVSGEYHSCALRTDGKVLCWGYNNKGQLGDGTNVSNRVYPGLSLVTLASTLSSSGSTVCAVEQSDSSLKCWGYDYYGGTGLRLRHLFFQFVQGLSF